MKNLVIVKSFPNGIRVTLDQDAPFLELLKETAGKFKESARFFKNAKVALAFAGRELSEDEETSLVEVIQNYTELEILCIMEEWDSEGNRRFLGALKEPAEALEDHSLCRIYRMHIHEGDVLESDRGIILLGSSDPGSLIVSKGDIIVCGTLAGEAIAGEEEDTERYIAAFDLCPSHLKIGSKHYYPKEGAKPKWFTKPKMEPKCARIAGSEIIIGPLDRSFIH